MKSRRLAPFIKFSISSGLCPSAYKTPIIAPALVPDITSGKIPASFNACITPRCANPLAPPPLKTRPILYCLADRVFSMLDLYKK
jgi:hypothetical protein